MDHPVDPIPLGAVEDPRFLAGELNVELHSAELKKELSLSNLVFTQVLAILGLSWIGTAGKLGASHLFFWMAAIAFFYIPSAAVVIHLNNQMPRFPAIKHQRFVGNGYFDDVMNTVLRGLSAADLAEKE